MAKTKRPYKPTLKQVLVRDYNWRMGNLRRLMMNCKTLDSDLASRAEWCVDVQMAREKANHQRRMLAADRGTELVIRDYIYDRARDVVRRAHGN